jgi:Cu/Zn superoxide dismutase
MIGKLSFSAALMAGVQAVDVEMWQLDRRMDTSSRMGGYMNRYQKTANESMLGQAPQQ